MASYNAYAEKRIDDLIKEAVDGDENISLSNQSLINAVDILEKEFKYHPLDSRKVEIMRIKNKMRIYEKILGVYDEIISQLPMEDDSYDPDEELKNI
jgi:hypothetical protein